MRDTCRKSLTESALNVTVGVALMFGVNLILLPLFGMPYNVTNFGILAVIQIAIGFGRSYAIRRLFVRGLYEALADIGVYAASQIREVGSYAYAHITDSLKHIAYIYLHPRMHHLRGRRHY